MTKQEKRLPKPDIKDAAKLMLFACRMARKKINPSFYTAGEKEIHVYDLNNALNLAIELAERAGV